MTSHSALNQHAVTITSFSWNGTVARSFKLGLALPLTEIWYYSGAGSVLPSKCGLFDNTGTLVTGTLKTSPTWSGAAGSGWVKTTYDGSVIIPANLLYQAACYVSGSSVSYDATGNGTGNDFVTNGLIYDSQSFFDNGGPTPDLTFVTGANSDDFLVDVGVSTPSTFLVSDNFNRSNGGLGSNWTANPDTDNFPSPLSIFSNSVAGAGGVNCSSFWNADAASDNQYSEIAISTLPAQGDWVGPMVRMSGDGTQKYFVIAWNNAGTYTFELFKQNQGTFTALGGETVSWASPTAGDVIRLEAWGKNLTVFKNGVAVLMAQDTDYTWGQPGMITFGSSSLADNWSAGAVTSDLKITLNSTSGHVKTYKVDTPINRSIYATTPPTPSPPQDMRVLTPTSPSSSYAHAFLWMLPVEPGQGTTFGDPIVHMQSLGYQDTYNLTCIQPGFPIDPWYADNDVDPGVLEETYMLLLREWLEANYTVTGREVHYLIGFSKSGIGGQRMFWRHQDLYAGVASWDFPGEETYGEFGGDSASVYGTEANWDNNYDVNGHLSVWKADGDTQTKDRVWIADSVSFDDSSYNTLLASEGILHDYTRDSYNQHNWVTSPDWMAAAITFLAGVGPPPVVAGCIGAAGIV